MSHRASLAAALVLFAICRLDGATIQVGPTRTYKSVLAGYLAASSGDTIEIDAATYYQNAGWVYINGKNNLTFRGVGGQPLLDAHGYCTQGKGIFVIEIGTSNTTIENIEMANARLYSGAGSNAAGVRMQGTGLTLRNCCIHDCDDGVLNGGGTVLFESCEFRHNGEGDGQSHNIYVNGNGSFTMRYCWSHNAVVGHQVKTRMTTNYLLYNLISDDGGTGSFEVDIPDAGTSYLIGNGIYQAGTGNSIMVNYGEESSNNPDRHLYMVNNTLVSLIGGTALNNGTSTTALVMNNVMQNISTMTGPVSTITNWTTVRAYLQNVAAYDFHLTGASTGAIDKGTTPGTGSAPASGVDGFSLAAVSEYVAPCSYTARPVSGALDIGAYEYYNTNRKPVVSTPADVNACETQLVVLQATASDPDGDPLTYSWRSWPGRPSR